MTVPAPDRPRRPGRVCMVVHAQYPLGETRVQREALALRDAGYEVDVVCLRERGEPRREVVDGVEVHRLPVRRHRGCGMLGQLVEYLAFAGLAAIRLGRLHRRRRYDVVHVHNLPDFLVFSAAPAKFAGARVVLDLHDLMPELFAGRAGATTGAGGRWGTILLFQERLSCRYADHVITVTDHWRDSLAARAVPADRVSVVMNLADRRIFTPAVPKPPPDDGGREEQRFEVLYHGTFTERYGVDLLVEAASSLRDSIGGLRVTLLGAGELADRLRELVRARGLEDRVWISAGMVPAADLPTAIARADVGVVPNRSNVFTDGILPTKLLEYVAMGTPTVVARTPGVARYFDDETVEFFTPGDVDALAKAIRRLYEDPVRRSELRRAAGDFNRRYDWSASSERFVATIDQLCEERP